MIYFKSSFCFCYRRNRLSAMGIFSRLSIFPANFVRPARQRANAGSEKQTRLLGFSAQNPRRQRSRLRG